jgi:hypothetical protein
MSRPTTPREHHKSPLTAHQENVAVTDAARKGRPAAAAAKKNAQPSVWPFIAAGAILLIVATLGSAMNSLLPTEAGGLSAIGLALLVTPAPGRLLKRVAPEPEVPHGVNAEFWQNLVAKTDAGLWIGIAERLLIVIAMLAQAPTLIVGWLAFKVASKWEAWRNVVQVPSTIDGVNDRDWLAARHDLGSWLLNRFWLGTLFNVLSGVCFAYLGTVVGRLLTRLH